MAQPVGHGYPDFGRFQAQADKLLDFLSNHDTDSSITRGRIFVGDIPYVGLSIQSQINNFEYQAYFWTAQTGGALLSTQSIDIRQGGTAEFAIPIGGPWLEMRIIPNATGSRFTYVSYSSHSALRLFTGSASQNVLLENPGVSVGAGATHNATTTRVAPGDAHWVAHFDSATSFRIRLESIDLFGGVKLIDFVNADTGSSSRRIFLPPTLVRISAFNNDAGARNLLYSVVTRPIAQGW